ncbi:MAG TPA: hypothetical protein ENO00_13665 [Deltaproteobacteria bacterium]|nr:hypothetical protein [Deltaproteobacteria bacterium]
MNEYLHGTLEEEVRFIAGSYYLSEEECLVFKDRTVLYTVGIATVDNACCGIGGCRFIRVAGYVVSWKERTDESGLPISMVDPILKEDEQRAIKNLLDSHYPHSQIYFDNV